MGHVKKILAYKKIQPIPTFYSDKLAVELAESFHLHIRNIRMEFDDAEFEKIARVFCRSLKKWNRIGRPRLKKNTETGPHFYLLGDSKIPPIPVLFNNEVANDELRIEIQKWADYIHLHYKELRIEFSVEEFKEFIKVVNEAAENLEKYSEGNPRRFGKFHRACPHGRVIKESIQRGQRFWINSSDNDASKPFETTFEKEDAELRSDTRFTDKPELIKIDVRDLFDITLFHSSAIAPWGCDANGIFLPLLYRYQFVKMIFKSEGRLDDKKIKSTNYWKLLQKGIKERPRDGGIGWVYKNPMEQCQRFIALIKAIKTYGYPGKKENYDFYKRFDFTPEVVSSDGTVYRQKNNETDFPRLITVMPCSGAYRAYNGLHRLAILKYLWDIQQLSSPRILVRKWTNSPFSHLDTIGVKYDKKGYPIGYKDLPLDIRAQTSAKDRYLLKVLVALNRQKNKIYWLSRRLLSRLLSMIKLRRSEINKNLQSKE